MDEQKDREFRQSQIEGTKIRPTAPRDLPTLRAAYSDRTATLMAYLSSFAYVDPPAHGDPVTLPPEISELGFTRLTYFQSRLVDGLSFVAEGPDLIAVSFRGTRSFKNWETNVDLWPTQVLPKTDAGLLVHEGFYNAFNLLSEAGLATKLGTIRAASGGKTPIYFCGHSLGGALAQIASAVFGGDDVAACYTFGSPRIGNALFDRWVKAPSYRDINYADIVPQLPPPGVYRHSGDPRYLPKTGNLSPFRFEPGPLIRFWQGLQGIWQFVTHGTFMGVQDHSMQLYASRLELIAKGREQLRNPLSGDAPGRPS